MTTFVELCAGSAAVSLRWLSSRAVPPIGYQGGKRGYANAILAALGMQPGGGRKDGRVVLVEPGPWGEAWSHWRTAEGRRDTCDRLRAWAGEDPRTLWERLRSEAVPGDRAERVAVWAVLQFWSFARKPVVVVADRWEEHGLAAANLTDSEWRDFRGDVGIRPASLLPDLSDRVDRLPDLSRVHVIHADATECPPIPGAVVYIDPPYQGTTCAYSHAMPRADVLRLAAEWRAHGCTVAVSEAEALPIPGAYHHRLPKAHGVVRSWSKQRDEWLTLSRPARGQLGLFPTGTG